MKKCFKPHLENITHMFLPRKILEERLSNILAEDVGQGDITSGSVIPPETMAKAEVIAKENGIAAGLEEATVLCESLNLKVETCAEDGDAIRKGQCLVHIQGDARTILAVERTLLNILSRMSGIATATRSVVEKLHTINRNVRVASTRKTAPGLLYFDKKAVLIGGGDTHRLHLDDLILIKDNHIAITGSIEKAVKRAHESVSISKKIEVEVTTIKDAQTAAKAGADIIMFDNMPFETIAKACKLLKKVESPKQILLEASGGITLDNVEEYAKTGVNVISMGALTNSFKCLDFSLEAQKD
jgi:nicotinate-nucleotide pyrophosphorylase (carboxylating)